MLKFFYRLKRRGGVVLFAVVAIMTLLIVMASVAYFTARSSYQTVLSNYDFSQTYLSATSVADMMLSAVAFDTSRDADNNYSGLRGLIKNIESDVEDDLKNEASAYDEDSGVEVTEIHYTDGTETKKIVFYNKEVSGSDKFKDKTPSSDSEIAALKNSVTIKGASHTDSVSGKFGDDLLDASMNDPVKGGVLDACEVSISLDWVKTLPVDKEEDKYTSNRYYYTFTTTAYYRGNSITVSDTLFHDSTLGGSPGLPSFDTFFTATGQVIGDKGKVKPSGADRTVIINTHLISDNAYFQNKDTVITRAGGGAADIKFLGGLRTSGNLWLDGDTGGNANLPKPDGNRRHDWIIGGDFYLSGNCPINFNGNCLYIRGDLFLATNSAPFKNLGAAVVEGNIYVLNASVTAFSYGNYDSLGVADKHRVLQGCFVKGNNVGDYGVPGGIYVANDDTNVFDYITLFDETETMPEKYKDYPHSMEKGKPLDLKYGNYHQLCNQYSTEKMKEWYEDVPVSPGKTVRVVHHTLSIGDYIHGVINSKIALNCTKAGFSPFTLAKAYQGGVNTFSEGKLYYNTGLTVSDTNFSSKRAGNYDDILGHISKLEVVEEDGDKKYVYSLTEGVKASDILSESGGLKNTEFDSFSAKQSALSNELVITFDSISTPGTTSFTSTNGETAYVEVKGDKEISNCKEVNITLPASDTGYLLRLVNNNTKIEQKWYWTPERGSYSEDVEVPSFPWNGNATITYYIRTPDDVTPGVHKTMPIVLAANYNDGNTVWNPKPDDDSDPEYGTPTDKYGKNSFAWRLGDSSEGGRTQVKLVSSDGTDSADGFVIFEMGNYEAGGDYTKYTKNNAASLETVVYRSSQKEIIGTKAQVEHIAGYGADSVSETALTSMFKNQELGITETDYDNHIILVSNKNDTRLSFTTCGYNCTTLCGYYYAPNSMFAAPAGNTAYPLFGGMIVSDYTIIKNRFMYAMPDPDLVEGLEEGLENITSTSSEGKNAWYVDSFEVGKNYLG